MTVLEALMVVHFPQSVLCMDLRVLSQLLPQFQGMDDGMVRHANSVIS